MSKKSDKTCGPFSDLIAKLQDANAEIAECSATLERLKADKTKSASDKVSAYMERYNAAILSFVNLGQECERLVKNQKAQMWREKDYLVKTILTK